MKQVRKELHTGAKQKETSSEGRDVCTPSPGSSLCRCPKAVWITWDPSFSCHSRMFYIFPGVSAAGLTKALLLSFPVYLALLTMALRRETKPKPSVFSFTACITVPCKYACLTTFSFIRRYIEATFLCLPDDLERTIARLYSSSFYQSSLYCQSYLVPDEL